MSLSVVFLEPFEANLCYKLHRQAYVPLCLQSHQASMDLRWFCK